MLGNLQCEGKIETSAHTQRLAEVVNSNLVARNCRIRLGNPFALDTQDIGDP